jgi:aminopeptidase
MSLDGMLAVNDVGDLNFPPGEVFTAPVVDSVEGEILFDTPSVLQGSEVVDVRLTLEEGVVTDYSARRNEAALESVLETDDDSSRLVSE